MLLTFRENYGGKRLSLALNLKSLKRAVRTIIYTRGEDLTLY